MPKIFEIETENLENGNDLMSGVNTLKEWFIDGVDTGMKKLKTA